MSVKVWGTNIEPNTLEQAHRTGELPVLAGHVALMPDAHIGVGATIGSVIPTHKAIIPSAVGVDIGCGMIAVETTLIASNLPDTLQPMIHQLGYSVPAGVGRSRKGGKGGTTDKLIHQRAEAWMGNHPHDLGDLEKRALAQLGTLGSGNHFIEVCLDERDVVWVLLHSGSRGVGNRLADKHIKIAIAQEQGLEDKQLSYFLDTQPEFHAYISDMLWSQEYALENRELMVTAALLDLFALVGHGRERMRINCHHNYATREKHNGRMVWVTRKGAIRARKGDKGLIPGSMATGSFVVEGLGNPASYNSASHGAGRQMSRGQARRTLTPESLDAAMGERAWNQNAKGLLDEHPAAYKDIGRVMSDQSDLVRIVHSLRQILNYKGL